MVRGWSGCLLIATAACGRIRFGNLADAEEARSIDAPADGFPDTPASFTCAGSGAFTVCLPTAPAASVMIGGPLNTDTSLLCAPSQPPGWTEHGQPPACFVEGDTIAVPSPLTVSGSRPLVLFAATSIAITNTIDVASHLNGKVGPGASTAPCTPGTPPGGVAAGGGGGAGGSLATAGGAGASGNGTGLAGLPGPTTTNPLQLRGGCSGDRGGFGTVANASGNPGSGGGAIYVVTAGALALDAGALINASGGGAAGPDMKCGGSGGGSGGMIVVWATVATVATGVKLVANGGGGSAGSDGVTSPPQLDGNDPDPNSVATPAPGGSGAGAGGRGDAGGMAATDGAIGQHGGGGGGAGAGFIRSNVMLGAAMVSPAATPIP